MPLFPPFGALRFGALALVSALPVLALSACAPELPPPPPPAEPPPPPPASPSFQPPSVQPGITGEGTITKIEARDRVSLTGPRVDAKPGDWLLENKGSVAVVAADGRLVDFGAAGGRDEIAVLNPTVFLGLSAAHLDIVSITPEVEGRVLHVVRRVLEKPLILHQFFAFSGDRLRVETAVTAASPAAAPLAITLGEQIAWGNTPTWAEGHGFITRGGMFATDFLARESYGVAYALCSESGRLMARFDAPDSGFHEEASTGETPQNVPLDTPTARRIITLAHAAGSLGRAALSLPCARAGAQHVRPPDGLPKSAHVDIGRCPARGRGVTPYARFLPEDGDIALPDGCFQMRLSAPGHTTSAWFATSAAVGRSLTPSGTLRFSVTDKDTGKPLPARVLVRGAKGQADPDWGEDPDAGAALNVIHAETGEGERPIPPGKYRVTIGRGFEYTAVEKELEIVAGRTQTVSAALERVVDTKGWISADLHLHAMPSPDALQPLADRVRALVATGVEVGVATDHNKVTDYKPVIAELKVNPWIASIVGDEVTTREPAYGHFNAFPLPSGAEPIPYKTITPKALFAAARAVGPLGAETIVQVNHPRMGGIGYFELLRFDRDDIRGWSSRVALAELGFDAIEVFNGDHYARIDKVEECLRDWYALIEAGHRYTATGNSDSHKLSYHEAGVPRNLVQMANDDPAAFDERAFITAVRKGKVVVSSGPFLRFEAGGKGVGETIAAGTHEISIVVDAPPWVDVDRVELVRRGEVWATWTKPEKKGPHRFVIHDRRALVKGDWIVAIARGSKPMTYLHRPNARPFAFTNPIWVE